MNWEKHMKDNVINWLLKEKKDELLQQAFLFLFGNPYLFKMDVLMNIMDDIQPHGLLYSAKYKGKILNFCPPVFGSPMAAMYFETIAQRGVKKVVTCGYIGGLTRNAKIGTYFVPRSSIGLDGTSKSYFPNSIRFDSSNKITAGLIDRLESKLCHYETGTMVSIDGLLLENDRMIKDFKNQGFDAVDLETAVVFGLGQKYSIDTAGIYIVTDNPLQKNIDEKSLHEASFGTQVQIALDTLLEV